MRINGSKPDEVNFSIPVSNGLLSPEHRKKIGPALWEFLWCVDHTTQETDGLGKVLGGKPVTYAQISADLGVSQKTAERHCKRLKMEGYIRLTRAPYGFQIQVAKSKKFFPKRVDRTVQSEGESGQNCPRDKTKVSERVDRSVGSNKTLQDITKNSIGHFGFAKFWKHYPKRKAKKVALKAFGKINPDEKLLGEMLRALEQQKRSDQWQRDGGKFIPHAATWLNGSRWEDEVEASLARQNTPTQAELKAEERPKWMDESLKLQRKRYQDQHQPP